MNLSHVKTWADYMYVMYAIGDLAEIYWRETRSLSIETQTVVMAVTWVNLGVVIDAQLSSGQTQLRVGLSLRVR